MRKVMRKKPRKRYITARQVQEFRAAQLATLKPKPPRRYYDTVPSQDTPRPRPDEPLPPTYTPRYGVLPLLGLGYEPLLPCQYHAYWYQNQVRREQTARAGKTNPEIGGVLKSLNKIYRQADGDLDVSKRVHEGKHCHRTGNPKLGYTRGL